MIEVKKKEGESSSALAFRFSKKLRQSGILAEIRRRRFKKRAQNKTRRRSSAIYRTKRKEEILRERRLGS